MTTRKRLTDTDYAEMAKDYAANPPTADEVLAVEVNPAFLRMGRPKGNAAKGKTPLLGVRLPEPIRFEVEFRVQNGESKNASELVRLALLEYFANHPTSSARSRR
jgi:hypothetical protein